MASFMLNSRFSHRTAVSIAVGLLLNVSLVRSETLTYADLVHRLTDMQHLATLPPPGEVGGLASSYDRASQYEAAQDKYIHWDANGDGAGFVRLEGDQQVMAEIKGPGCIWRIWSADPHSGHVRIYLDGAPAAAIDLPFINYFSANSVNPFSAWTHLVYQNPDQQSSGANNFVPISFNKSCKIVGDAGTPGNSDNKWGGYFQFTYTRFAPGTNVPTFRLPIPAADAAELGKANATLANCAGDPAPRPGQKDRVATVTVAPEQTSTALNLEGVGAISLLKIKVPLPDSVEAKRNLLRQLTIRMTWDGAASPAVWAPLGDFFAEIGGAGSFATLPCGLTDDGTFYCHWYMPYEKGAKIELGNDSSTPIPFSVHAVVVPLDAPIATLTRFHAKWHREAFMPNRSDRQPDWTMLTTTGMGRFVGTMLHVWNPGATWWGEGDDKFFVDGEKFPSYFGTGSEDFFGYAWGNPGRFVQAFHAQPLNENNCGHVDDMRWFITDNVPFQKSFEGCIEKYFPNGPVREQSTYADTSFWYLDAKGTDPYTDEPRVGQRMGYWTRNAVTYREPDVIEAEALEPIKWHSPSRIEDMWGAWPGPPEAKAGVWSGDMQLAWPSALNEELELKLPVEKGGSYKFMICATRDSSYGIFQFFIDGSPLGNPVDLYGPGLARAGLAGLGTVQLSAGNHVLKIRNVGKNPSIKNGSIGFGLDYIKLVPVP
jgi:hypothetical protein